MILSKQCLLRQKFQYPSSLSSTFHGCTKNLITGGGVMLHEHDKAIERIMIITSSQYKITIILNGCKYDCDYDIVSDLKSGYESEKQNNRIIWCVSWWQGEILHATLSKDDIRKITKLPKELLTFLKK